MEKIGIKFGFSSIPQYQDISFKIDLPTGTKYGRFSLFGIGGISYVALLAKDKKQGDFTIVQYDQDVYYYSNMGVTGLTHTYFYNDKTKQTISLAVSGTENITKLDSLYNNKQNSIVLYGGKASEVKYSFVYNFNKKVNASNTFNAGLIADIYHYNYADSFFIINRYLILKKFTGNSSLIQSYVKWQHKFSNKLTLNTGIHHQQFLLTHTLSIEPRIGLKWNFTPKQSISIGAGMHSQLQPMSIYFYETQNADSSYSKTNINLGFSKSNHLILAYDNAFALNWRIKTELYYQYLFSIPVESNPSVYSVLNAGADFYIPTVDSLKNNGIGKNYGIEFTLERFFSKNYYLLITASLFDSKYKGSDGVEHNTVFNGNYTTNALAGAEFNLDKDNRMVLTINSKVNFAGGKRFIPLLAEESQLQHKAVYDYVHAFEKRYPDYSRVDFKIGFKLNSKKLTQEWAFDAQNVFNRKNVFQTIYNPQTNNMETEYQLGFFPMMTYRILF